MQCNDNYSWMSHTCALIVLVFCYFTATADPFPLGVRAVATAAPLYVQASVRVGAHQIRVGVRPSATADQIVPWYRISAMGGDHHWRPTALVQWYIGPVAQRACVAAFDLVRLPCFDWPDGLRPVAHSLALALAFALREANPFQRQDTLYPNVFV